MLTRRLQLEKHWNGLRWKFDDVLLRWEPEPRPDMRTRIRYKVCHTVVLAEYLC